MIWRARSEAKHPPAVVMALIDEKSLATKGRWPWPRSKIAALVDSLSQDKARVIGLDIEKWDRSRMALPES
jgi:adenylate cyclase